MYTIQTVILYVGTGTYSYIETVINIRWLVFVSLLFFIALITLNQATVVMYWRLELDNSCVTCVIIFI